MIPIKDENPTARPAVVTVLLLVACAAVWFFVQQARTGTVVVTVPATGQQIQMDASLAFTLEYAAVPCELTQGEPLSVGELEATFNQGSTEACGAGGEFQNAEVFPEKPIWLTAVLSMFLHGSLLHLGGNLLFLWIFGNNVEDRLGHFGYVVFYLVGGVVATVAHVLVNSNSTLPVVGASGAIAAVMGAYLVWFPNVRIRTLITAFFIWFTEVRAKWLLGFWFVLQFLTSDNSGVAWVAHVAGFVFGVVVALLIGPGRTTPRADRPVLGDPYWA